MYPCKGPDDPILSWRGTLSSVGSHINYYHEFRNTPPPSLFPLSFLFHFEARCLFLQQSGRNLTRYDRRGEETLEMEETAPNQRMAVITENNVPTFRRPLKPTYTAGLSNRDAMGNKLLTPTRECCVFVSFLCLCLVPLRRFPLCPSFFLASSADHRFETP